MKRVPEKPEEDEFYLNLLLHTYQDAAYVCNIGSSSSTRDILTITGRFATEGMSFLTKTLPSLGKCLDEALGRDYPFPKRHSFELSKKSPYLPKFLGEFWTRIFSTDGDVMDLQFGTDGYLSQVVAVRAVRQICYLLYKLELPYSPDQEAAVIDKFVSTDRELPEETDEENLSPRASRTLENARLLIWWVLKDLNPWAIIPSHGPGAVATGEKSWEKMKFSRLYTRLDDVYPYSDFMFFNYSHLCDELDTLEDLETRHESVAKVCLVPKDSRGPRLISMEPLEMQWIQQGLMKELFRKIEDPSSLCSGYVNFTYQDVNRRLALAESESGDFVTLDMEEASDRVSMWLVARLFPEPLLNCLRACRSGFTILPDGRQISLKKFAPMGSAVCFPVEALVFWALSVGSLVDLQWRPPIVVPPVYVYGDDIVMRKHDYIAIEPLFKEFHLKFNEGKCCTGRFFRESCGMDAFRNMNVTPLRCRTLWSGGSSPAAALSYVAYANGLRDRGYVRSSNYLSKHITEIWGEIPVTNRTDELPFTFRYKDWNNTQIAAFNKSALRSRYNRRLQRVEVWVKQFVPRHYDRGHPGWSELLRILPHMASFRGPLEEVRPALRPNRFTVPRQFKTRGRWLAVEQLFAMAH